MLFSPFRRSTPRATDASHRTRSPASGTAIYSERILFFRCAKESVPKRATCALPARLVYVRRSRIGAKKEKHNRMTSAPTLKLLVFVLFLFESIDSSSEFSRRFPGKAFPFRFGPVPILNFPRAEKTTTRKKNLGFTTNNDRCGNALRFGNLFRETFREENY